MHMADALLSPAVGITMWTVSAGAIALCSSRLRREPNDRQAPLMGVLGAFVFAAQMINFSIPGTGSSGHLGGGLLLSALLGPQAAFLTIASVLVVQAFFFADGGLLALGCNIFNLGIMPAFLVFPLFYRRLSGAAPSRIRTSAVTVLCAVLSAQLGALAVVLETALSGVSALPVGKFLMLMQPIHGAIGIVEGAVTVAVLSFVRQARPELLAAAVPDAVAFRPRLPLLLGFLLCALLTAGALSGFASKNPDGLEWSIGKVSGSLELPSPGNGLHAVAAALQQRSAWFPDYHSAARKPEKPLHGASEEGGSALAGVAGTLITLLLVLLAGAALRRGGKGAVAPEP